MSEELHPFECPYCGSTASHGKVSTWLQLDGHDHNVLACTMYCNESSMVLDKDDDCRPAVAMLKCDDCGTVWGIVPTPAVVRVLITEGE